MNPELRQSSIRPDTVDFDPLRIHLDWRAYFEAFMEEHGIPINWGGRLLFPDGWTYSATDHAGPEWPPPQDENLRREYIAAYWTERLAVLKMERDQLFEVVSSLEQLQHAKSAPLMHSITRRGDDGLRRRRAVPLEIDLLRERLELLSRELETCEDRLREVAT